MAKDRERFDAIRRRYVLASQKRDEFRTSLSIRYGEGYSYGWLTQTERKKLERLNASIDREQEKFYDLLDAVSSRNWRAGVPIWWVCEKLTWEDATRALDSPLSVAPPLSYGATQPIT